MTGQAGLSLLTVWLIIQNKSELIVSAGLLSRIAGAEADRRITACFDRRREPPLGTGGVG